MPRTGDFDLAAQLVKPSFTPGQRDAPALVELIVDGNDRATAAIAELGEAGRVAIEARLGIADEAGRSRLVVALGLLARGGDPIARAALLGHATDGSSRVRRAAIVALGKLGGDDAGIALVARWDAADVTPDERRALAEALGKLGGAASLSRLRALEPGDDVELGRRRDRAVLMADRTAARDEASTIATEVAPPRPLVVRLRCKPGLGGLLVEDLTRCGFRPASRSDAAADVTLDRPWSALFASRLWSTAAIRVELPRGGELAAAITEALTAPQVRALLRAWTRGPIRWRLGFAHGHKRAVVWRVAKAVTAAAPELVNDPTQTTWDVLVDDDATMLELVPRRADDPRFAWRVADLPAASHPTVAAAIAFVAQARPDDRVWDPFVGSAAELVERARLGPFRSLLGTDVSDAALTAARANLDAAGVAATLTCADARSHGPGAVDLIITNPPLGGRIQLDAATLLVEALPNLVRALAPAGRLVWITPAPRKTSPVAERLGLHRTRSHAVDLGGVRGHLERWDR